MNLRILLLGSHARHERDLDAYLDGALKERDGLRFERHLDSCESCRMRIAEGQRLQSLLGSLPELSAPRSFAITENMVREPRPVPAARSSAWSGALRGMQGTAAAGIALFAVLVAVDASGGTTASDAGDNDLSIASLTASADDSQRSSGTDVGSSTEGYDTGGEDDGGASSIAPPKATAGGVGATSNQPPATTVADTGDSSAGSGPSDTPLPESAVAGPSGNGDVATTAALRTGDDEGGLGGLRLAEIAAAAVAVVAIAGYAITRRLAPAKQR